MFGRGWVSAAGIAAVDIEVQALAVERLAVAARVLVPAADSRYPRIYAFCMAVLVGSNTG